MEVVSDISLEVAAGETVAIIGRNGAGKTTSVNVHRRPSVRREPTGRVDLGGKDLSKASAEENCRRGPGVRAGGSTGSFAA